MRSLKARLASYKGRPAASTRYQTEFKKSGWRTTAGHFGLGAQGSWYTPDEPYPDTVYMLFEAPGFRDLGEAHKIVSLKHTGWYADNHQDMLYVGKVYQLPAKDGVERYLAGFIDKEGGTVTLCPTLFEEKNDAAWYADSLAESGAEESREFYAKDQAERDIQQAREAIHELNQEALPIIREARQAKFSETICGALKAHVRALLNDRSRQFKIIEERKQNYWSAAPNF